MPLRVDSPREEVEEKAGADFPAAVEATRLTLGSQPRTTGLISDERRDGNRRPPAAVFG